MAICCCFWDLKEWVCYKREGKDSPLMHIFFLPCLLSFLSMSLFLFFFVISLSILSISCLSLYPLPFMAIVPFFIGSSLWDFSILLLWLTNHFCLLWKPLQGCPLSYWLFGHHYIWSCSMNSLSSTTRPTTDPNSFGFAVSFSFLASTNKVLGLSTYLSSMHQVIPAIYYLFWAKMTS